MCKMPQRVFSRNCWSAACLFATVTATAAELTPWLELQAKAEVGWMQHSEQPDNLGAWWRHGTGQLAVQDDHLKRPRRFRRGLSFFWAYRACALLEAPIPGCRP